MTKLSALWGPSREVHAQFDLHLLNNTMLNLLIQHHSLLPMLCVYRTNYVGRYRSARSYANGV